MSACRAASLPHALCAGLGAPLCCPRSPKPPRPHRRLPTHGPTQVRAGPGRQSLPRAGCSQHAPALRSSVPRCALPGTAGCMLQMCPCPALLAAPLPRAALPHEHISLPPWAPSGRGSRLCPQRLGTLGRRPKAGGSPAACAPRRGWAAPGLAMPSGAPSLQTAPIHDIPSREDKLCPVTPCTTWRPSSTLAPPASPPGQSSRTALCFAGAAPIPTGAAPHPVQGRGSSVP